MSGSKAVQFNTVFEFEKATKTTFKYNEKPETGQPPRIGSLYIQKWVVGAENPPRELTVSVQVAA